MTGAAARIRRILENTGLYTFPGDTLADWELAAFDAGFRLVEDGLEELLADLFIQTASEESLETRELLFRPQRTEGELERRRAALLARYASDVNGCTPERLSQLLHAACMEGRVMEKQGNGVGVDVWELSGITREEAGLELETLMPAHLPFAQDYTLTWKKLDGEDRTFAQRDGEDKTWTELDAREFC